MCDIDTATSTTLHLRRHCSSSHAHGECPRWAKLGLEDCLHHHLFYLNPLPEACLSPPTRDVGCFLASSKVLGREWGFKGVWETQQGA
jgi:hypothetical protein